MAPTSLAEISRSEFSDLSRAASITEVKHLASYNWIEALTPTIAVPGSPHLWSAPKAPQQLKKDSGLVYIAQNAARHPDSPLEPLFRALYIENPTFDIRSIDVVTDRNNIRKLLSFINPGSAETAHNPFTINVEVAKNTAIFSRDETMTQETIGLHEFRGFGHEFEKRYTSSQIEGSTGHHRIISYRFGNLNYIIRHETDGYVDTDAKIPSFNSKEPERDGLSSLLESLSLSTNKGSPTNTPTGSKLTVKEEGHVTPLESNLEIKTRVIHKPLNIQDVAPQLWISQTLKLVRAYHYKGTFQRPEVEDVAAPIKRWEEQSQTDLRKLAALVEKIVNVVKAGGGNAVVKYDVMKGKLVVWKADGKKMLPKDLYGIWDDERNVKAKTTSERDAGPESDVSSAEKMENKVEKKSSEYVSGDTKGKGAAKVTKKEQAPPNTPIEIPMMAKKTQPGLQDKEGEDGR